MMALKTRVHQMEKIIFFNGPSLILRLSIEDNLLTEVHLSTRRGKGLEVQLPESESHNILTWIEAYVQKKPFDELPPHRLFLLPPFTTEVLKIVSEIPFGKVVSYKELAIQSGSPKSARAVGTVCHQNPFPFFIPCHRVIGSNGEINGYLFGLDVKQELLEFEGVI